MQLSKRITLWREAAGLTRQELAELIGVTPAAVYQWEGGAKGETAAVVPSTRNVVAMASAFGVSLERFWGEPPVEERAS